MKICRFVCGLLVLCLLAAGLTACDVVRTLLFPEEESTSPLGEHATVPPAQTTAAPVEPNADMTAILAEIDSMSVEDFTETDQTTEYVKITVKDFGEMVIRLRPDIAPISVENFQKLVSEGFYNGLTFHRIMKNFVIQGGDPKGNGTGGSRDTIKGEFKINGVQNDLSHVTGVISMARRSSPMDSATSQFFICNANVSRSLDGSYAAFGYVVAGLDVVLTVSEVEVKANIPGYEVSVPVNPVVMEKICFVTPN